MARGQHDVGRDQRACAQTHSGDVDRDDSGIPAFVGNAGDDLDGVDFDGVAAADGGVGSAAGGCGSDGAGAGRERGCGERGERGDCGRGAYAGTNGNHGILQVSRQRAGSRGP